MTYHLRLLVGLTFVFMYNCRSDKSIDHYSHIDDESVKSILQKAFDSAGGLETYLDLDSVVFDKRTILYLSDGKIESEVQQHHKYGLQPSASGRISWTDSLGRHEVVHGPNGSYKSLNEEKIEDSSASAKSVFMSNYYVLFLPFKLLDPGTILSYEGVTSIDGHEVDIVKATYAPAVHENHSTSDDWYLFFSKSDGRVVANLVYHEPTYAFIENNEWTDKYPLRMNVYRQTWRTDFERNKEYLRGEFWYNNYRFKSLD